MILGLGNDLVDIRRIERLLAAHPNRFAERVFTSAERAYAEQQKNPASTLAKRFAAKEACAKALGVGLKVLGARLSNGVSWQEIQIHLSPEGQPLLQLHGGALQRAQQMLPREQKLETHVSLGDQYPYALATVILSSAPIEEKKT